VSRAIWEDGETLGTFRVEDGSKLQQPIHVTRWEKSGSENPEERKHIRRYSGQNREIVGVVRTVDFE
jgi:hypothetical protein